MARETGDHEEIDELAFREALEDLRGKLQDHMVSVEESRAVDANNSRKKLEAASINSGKTSDASSRIRDEGEQYKMENTRLEVEKCEMQTNMNELPGQTISPHMQMLGVRGKEQMKAKRRTMYLGNEH